jgi:hypothetical protein
MKILRVIFTNRKSQVDPIFNEIIDIKREIRNHGVSLSRELDGIIEAVYLSHSKTEKKENNNESLIAL